MYKFKAVVISSLLTLGRMTNGWMNSFVLKQYLSGWLLIDNSPHPPHQPHRKKNKHMQPVSAKNCDSPEIEQPLTGTYYYLSKFAQ